jgi:hypothetical protein
VGSGPKEEKAMNASGVQGSVRLPLWVLVASVLGLVWNVFGLFQFALSLQATPESLIAGGMTAEQAAVMTSYPGWMTAAFAVGTLGGTIGCGLLLLCRAQAVLAFSVSLVAYLALYYGDIVHGVFAALGTPQIVVLTTVVAIAAVLLMLTVFARRRGWLA